MVSKHVKLDEETTELLHKAKGHFLMKYKLFRDTDNETIKLALKHVLEQYKEVTKCQKK